jgi:hypothetical protein
MAEHTPGPWKAMGATVYAGEMPIRIESGWQEDSWNDDPEAKANAKLAAAAPDLLAALQYIRDYARDSRTGRMLSGEGYQMAEEAIAKATGKDRS